MLNQFSLSARIPPYELAEGLGPAGPTETVFSHAAQPLSVVRIPIDIPASAGAATLTVIVRTSDRALQPLLALVQPSQYLPLNGRNEADGAWTYSVPPTIEPDRCASPPGGSCVRDGVSLIMLNTANKVARYTIGYKLEAVP